MVLGGGDTEGGVDTTTKRLGSGNARVIPYQEGLTVACELVSRGLSRHFLPSRTSP